MNPTQPQLTSAAVARVLRDAAQYLTDHGWCQRLFTANHTDQYPAACALGAIAVAAFGEPVDDPYTTELPGWHKYDKAELALCRYLGGPWDGVPAWNDAEDRTADDVIRTVRDAADWLEGRLLQHLDGAV
jgi:hypothetical protein